MRVQFIWQLVSFVAVNVLVSLTACVSSTSIFAIRWLPTIRNDMLYQFLDARSTRDDLSPELVRRYREWNERRLSELNDCLEMGDCAPNRSKVVLVDARWFEGQAIEIGWKRVGPGRQGLGLSAYKHFRQMGYTTLFSKNFEEALDQYSMFPDLVKLVIHDKAVDCYMKPNCVQGPSNPAGIPAWKIFDFELFLTLFQDIVQS